MWSPRMTTVGLKRLSKSHVLPRLSKERKSRQPNHYRMGSCEPRLIPSRVNQPPWGLHSIANSREALLFLSATMQQMELGILPSVSESTSGLTLAFQQQWHWGEVVSLPSEGVKHTTFNWMVCQTSPTSQNWVVCNWSRWVLQSIKKGVRLQLI